MVPRQAIINYGEGICATSTWQSTGKSSKKRMIIHMGYLASRDYVSTGMFRSGRSSKLDSFLPARRSHIPI